MLERFYPRQLRLPEMISETSDLGRVRCSRLDVLDRESRNVQSWETLAVLTLWGEERGG